MCEAPEASVVIPVYRGAQYIAQALSSVFAQTFTRYEVIVVNDGSPETQQIENALRPYQEKVIYFQQANAGASAARNTGIRRSRGTYIAFLDCDDAWYPNYLAEQLSALRADPGLDLVYCDTILIGASRNAGKTAMEINPSHGPVTLESLLKLDCKLITSGTVVRRQSLLNAGLFDENLRCCEDYDMWVRIADRGARMAYQCKVLGLHRIHPEATTANESYLIHSQIAVFTKLGQTLALIPRHQAIVQKQIARCMANIQLHRSKVELMAGQYSESAKAVRLANNYFQCSKLRRAEWIIRIAPGALRLFYRMRNQWHARIARKKLSAFPIEITSQR
jgi:glycosyltransferase involved in cell wall biosynthesis